MTDMQKDDSGHLIAWQSFLPLPDSAGHEEKLQGALRADIGLFDLVQTKATAWMDRRLLAFETGTEALADMAACRDPVSAAAIWAGWMAGSLNRIAEDVCDAQDLALKAMAAGEQTVRAID